MHVDIWGIFSIRIVLHHRYSLDVLSEESHETKKGSDIVGEQIDHSNCVARSPTLPLRSSLKGPFSSTDTSTTVKEGLVS